MELQTIGGCWELSPGLGSGVVPIFLSWHTAAQGSVLRWEGLDVAQHPLEPNCAVGSVHSNKLPSPLIPV